MATTRRNTATAVKPAAESRPAPRRRTASRSRKSGPKLAAVTAPAVDAAQRRQMIAEAAYFLAEQRGFGDGDPHGDWLQAEAAIDRILEQGGG